MQPLSMTLKIRCLMHGPSHTGLPGPHVPRGELVPRMREHGVEGVSVPGKLADDGAVAGVRHQRHVGGQQPDGLPAGPVRGDGGGWLLTRLCSWVNILPNSNSRWDRNTYNRKRF